MSAETQPTCDASLEAQILKAGRRVVIAIAGGGSRAIGALLGLPGASRTVLETITPQAEAALAEWIGAAPESFCSERTARAMAMASWRRARALSPGVDPATLVGIGSTAALVTDRPKRGEHRVHVAAQTRERTFAMTLRLEKGRRSRAEEESVAERAILATLADVAGARPIDLTKSPPGIEAESRDHTASRELRELLCGERRSVPVGAGERPPVLLAPGSFNPFHAGHERLVEYAERTVGAPAVLELSVTNVDKPPLDFLEIEDRLATIGERSILLTAAPTFVEKARLAPGCVFAVGVDTAERLGDARYTAGDTGARDRQFAEMADLGCRFLVFGRTLGDRFTTLADLAIPPELAALCEEVPEAEFREDVSSTELRRPAG